MNQPARQTGRISVHPRGFGFLTIEGPEGESSAFIAPPDLNDFLDGDQASAEISTGKDGRTSAAKLELVQRTRTELFGSVLSRGKKRLLKVDRAVSNTDWPFAKGSADDLADGASVVAAIRDGEVVPLRTVEPNADLGLERCVVRHGLRATFAPEVIAAARASAATRDFGERRDLRDVPTVTIDAASTTDIDDALSAYPAGPDGALRVLVSIADVDAFVPEGSPVDAEARLRGTSVYLAGRVLHMLPEALSSEAASLLQGQVRPALTAELRIDPEGKVTSVDLYASLLRSHARLTYDAVAELMATGRSSAVPEGVVPTLRWLRTAAARLSAVRAARGGVEVGRDEAYVSFDPATREPTAVEARGDTEAHRLVERLMVAANEAVADWLATRGQPGVFRVHDQPTPDRVALLAQFAHNFGLEAGFGPTLSPRGFAAFEAQYRGTSVAPAIRTVLGKMLGPARYTVQPGSHYGLAAPLYLHFTSPIRRYADLLVHRIVKRYLAGDRTLAAGDPALEALSQQINASAWRATKAENERHRMIVARWFAGRLGERSHGNVVGVKPFGLIVQLQGTGVTGTVAMEALPGGPFKVDASGFAAVAEGGKRFSVGDPLEVVVSAANEELGRVELTLAGEPQA
ncbi:MAG TPA: RNB domain-containing ribonuclease [Myxococcales bacterium]|jgi:ribonuclease R